MKTLLLTLVLSGLMISSVFGQSTWSISGNFNYLNASSTPMDVMKVVLQQGSLRIDSVMTNVSGHYNFTSVANGTYKLLAFTTKPWGSVNATDAIKVQRHFAGLEIMTDPVRLQAADVNMSNSINATDAIKIKRRFSALDSYFDRGDWTIAKPIVGGDTIIVNGANVIQNFDVLCVGDVNGSNNPLPTQDPPTVITVIATNISLTSATSGGNLFSDGGSTITAKGICWNTSSNPTIADSHTSDGSGVGNFVSSLTGLNQNALYYVRAYATNSIGTAYGNEVSFTTLSDFTCGTSITINHLNSGGVAPVNKTVTYGIVTNIPGEPSKCWITSNLGADHQATAVDDATEASAGWYWQFNLKQGFKHDGTTRTPNTTWITSIGENSDWISSNDPCTIEMGSLWRIPTYTELNNVSTSGGWTDWNGPWNSGLKLHAAGDLLNSPGGSLDGRGSRGYYWSSMQSSGAYGRNLCFASSWGGIDVAGKAYGSTLRCLRNPESPASAPTVTTTAASNIGSNTATSGGNVTNDGGATVTARGVCWNTSSSPSTANSHTTDGSGTGSFVSNLTGLTQNTLYYVRAYATNSVGTTYGNQVSFTTSSSFTCGSSLTINHLVSGGVAPVSKTVTYGTVTNIPGETSKCWITSNLGADHPATAKNDATEASAGWYWQFNRKQGFKHDGTTRTPNTTWITSISENLDWQSSNDPCALELGSGWRIPSYTEWNNVYTTGGWTDWNGPWNSGLKMHAAGTLGYSDGSLSLRGSTGYYWSSTQYDASGGWHLAFSSYYSYMGSFTSGKAYGFTLRCLRNSGSPATAPIVTTTTASNIGSNTATSGGNVTNDGGAPVTARGVCWNTSPNPTITNNHTADGNGAGTFVSNIAGLAPNTLYYVRAYATNGIGTSYGSEVSFTTSSSFTCGSSFAITHSTSGGVAPVNKTVTYGTITNIPGELSKCWITSNLGADHQATAVNDATEASAGWYWQFNLKQGYKHDGTIRTPNTTWITSINENSDWQTANDPCTIEIGSSWRIPTYTEWLNVDAAGNWTDWYGPWNSGLKMHAAGEIVDGSLSVRGSFGFYRCSTQSDASFCWDLSFSSGGSQTGIGSKTMGFSLRCVRNSDSPSNAPTVTTTAVSNIGSNAATSGGNVTNDGGATVTARGVCWSVSQDPTISSAHTTDGTGTGSFISNMTGLTSNTTYYVRSYATNSVGTAYGVNVQFSTTVTGSLTDNLISYWKIDETSGTTSFDSYGSNNCTIESGVTINQSGLINKSAAFIESSGGLTTGKTASQLGIGGEASKSVSIWIKPDTSNDVLNSGGIINLGNPADHEQFGIKLYSYWMFDSWYGAVRIGADNDILADGIWHHIVVTYTSNTHTIRTYLDGALVTEDSSYVISVGDDMGFSIGIGSQGNYIGLIDEVGLWSRALTNNEVHALYNNGNGLPYPF